MPPESAPMAEKLPEVPRRTFSISSRRLENHFSRRPTTVTVASHFTNIIDPLPKFASTGLFILFASLVPTRKNKRFEVDKRAFDPVGGFVFGMPLGFLTLLSIGLKECINIHIPKHSSDAPGSRRDRMTPLQVLWTLWLRCIVFLYASAVPALLLVGPWSQTARTNLKAHHEAHHGPANISKTRMTGILIAEVILGRKASGFGEVGQAWTSGSAPTALKMGS
ncbi:hypothetical protein B0T16DRAFT_388862 [Cercophora newfieldiana]|uniref:Uncharacterized protein n=1 Tax=Cercophora newfieldiana TaxID=92897 RepID=A0AA39Y9S2_9PEZI|nr:hypothetical protein B0T16DRAFT_388862 [Cercophora newfieldiana]